MFNVTHKNIHRMYRSVVGVVLLTNEEGMAIVLLEDAADPRDVLDCKFEHHQLHWCLGHLVVLV